MGGVFAAGHSAVEQHDEFFASRECFHYDMVTARADDPVWAAMQQRHAALENEFAASCSVYADNLGCVCVCFPSRLSARASRGPEYFCGVFLRMRADMRFAESARSCA